MKTKLLSLFVALICASSLSASYKVDGIWYDLDSSSKTASVTYRGNSYYDYDNEYSGSVVIPETVTYNSTTYSVTTIGEGAFRNCKYLTSVIIPNSVTTIGNYAFRGCSGLTSVTIPNSVTKIGDGAFYGCSGLTSVTIPNSVTTIGNYAFGDCSGLTSVTIPNSVTTIGDYAFEYCSGLKRVYITDLEKWYKIFFGSSSSNPLRYAHNLYLNNELVTNLVIPYSVTMIGNYAFCGCSGLTSVTIPNSVTKIGDGAFYDCSGLTSVTIPNSVTTIGGGAFLSCSGLTSVTIPNSVTTIGNYAFDGCSGLKGVYTTNLAAWCKISFGNLTANPLYYAHNLYLNNELVMDLAIPNSVTTIGDYAFSGCNLSSITIPNSVTMIGNYAFYGCSGLTSVTIPNSVTKIGDWAFNNCSGLTSVTIPNSVTTIGVGAFLNCRGLTSPIYNTTIFAYMPVSYSGAYTIPNGIEQIAGRAFYNCSGLTSINIPNSVTTIEEMAFYNCANLTSITIPTSVTTIGEGAFFFCEGLTSATIPNSVTTIGDDAFHGCTGLTSVTIPNSVTTIGNYAFYGCTGLTSVTCYAVTPPKCVGAVFSGINYNAKVYVPASALADYQNAEVWKDMLLLPIAADVTPMDDENPIILPTDQDVTITWPMTDGTNTYTLTISKNGEVVCVLTFNTDGQLLNIAFAAPGHDGSHQAPAATLTAQGYQFTVTGLDPGTAYDYSVTATDAGGKTLAEHKGNFSTTGGTGLNTLPYEGKEGIGSKFFHNGNLIIERNGVKYTATGQKVR